MDLEFGDWSCPTFSEFGKSWAPSMGYAKPLPPVVTELPIHASVWDPTCFRATLTELDPLSAIPRWSQQSRMNWFHLERDRMDFTEFQAAARDNFHLSDYAWQKVSGLLSEVQGKNERTRPGGCYGQQMSANFVQVDLGPVHTSATYTARSTACFLSLPHIVLLPYQDGKAASPHDNTRHHPQPLLRSHFFTNSKSRELSQALSTLVSQASAQCLHVSDIWILFLDDGVLTCSRQSLSELSVSVFSFDSAKSCDVRDVQVTSAAGRSWLVAANPSSSLTEFVSVFGDNVTDLSGWKRRLTLNQRSTPLSDKLWTRMMDSTDHWDRALHMDLIGDGAYTGGAPKAKTLLMHVCQVLQHDSHANEYMMIIFARTASSSPTTFTRELGDKLHELAGQCHRKERSTLYDNQLPGAPIDIDTWLEARQADFQSKQTHQCLDTQGPDEHHKIAIVLIAKFVFGFFWPRDFRHPMTDKFWGALKTIIDGPHAVKGLETRYAKFFFLSLLEDTVAPYVYDLTSSPLVLDTKMEFPDQFHQAWVHFLMTFILLANYEGRSAQEHLQRCSVSLCAGTNAISARVRPASNIVREICPPEGIAALCIDKLIRDLVGGYGDSCAIYTQAIQKLDFRLTHKPFSRAYQDSILAFRLEIDAVQAVRKSQLEVFEGFSKGRESNLQAEQKGHSQPAVETVLPSFGECRLDQLLQATRKFLLTDVKHFDTLRRQLDELESRHHGIIASNKDRQDAAIMAFTIVTMVFLPLSFVASVFGMNSSDIRSMESRQWVYWVISVPFTIVIVLGGLWWTGLCRVWWRWLQKRWALKIREVEDKGLAPQRGVLMYGHEVLAHIARERSDTFRESGSALRGRTAAKEAC